MLSLENIRVSTCFLLVVLVGAQGPGPGPGRRDKYADQNMQSRAVDTRVNFEIPEGQPKGTVAGKIPTKPGFTYRFNEAPREFILDPVTGEIKTNVILDRETLKNDRYDLVILSSQPTYPIEVRIIVTDINDNSPEFPESSIAISFSESAVAGTRLLLDAATDKDIGVNSVSDNYKIIAGNEDKKFRLVVTTNPTGDSSYLHLETTGKLDRETQGFYNLNVSAQDGGKPPRYGYLQVNVTILDVNDNPPIFDHSDYIVSLNESVPPGTPVLQVMATDNDLGDNAKLTYYLNDNERQFTVDPETGVISTTEPLNCPAQQNCPQSKSSCPKSCVFTVFARDHGMPRQDGRTYVTVNLLDANDHSPVIKFRYFPATAGFATVDENAGNGSVVAAVSVVDQDDGLNGETTVKIVAGNELNNFRLDYTPSFDIVRVNGVLDREEISKYNLTVVATDKGNPPRTATAFLIIHVNDVNDHEPVFEKSEYSAILSELAPPGTYVAGITATDEDTGVNAQIYYAFVSGNENQWFKINQDSGLITTVAALDREVQGTVELNISARDGGPNPKWAYTQLKVTILDENDGSPEFSQSRINVSLSESTPPGTLVAMLTAVDRDQGTNGSVTYSLHSNVKQKYDETFFLDSLTGQLTTKKKLDREEVPFYEIQVVARDQGIPPQSSTATVFLRVLDENDNAPEFYPQKYFKAVADDLKIGSSVLRVTATDLDEGDNSVVTYKIEDQLDSLFSIDQFTGVITLRGNLKGSSKHIYRILVSAKDNGDMRATEDAVVEVVKEKYMEELTFENYGGYEFQILEDLDDTTSFKRRNVGTVSVRNHEATYSIIYGDPHKNFYINENSGKITTAKKIDREQSISYSLTVMARSRLSYGKTTVNIIVQDLNDNKPTFLKYRDDIRLDENVAVGQEVYLARARDLDSGINSRISYALSYNPEDQFRISEATGVIYLNKPIRAEPNSILHVEVTATDSGAPPLSSKLTVDIAIADVNDHTPVFDHTSYETSLLESTPVNDRFFALAASDADLDLNGRITYEITEGNLEQKFGVFPDGFLYLKKSLDREEKDYYSLTIMAKDMGNPSRFSVVPVVIHVIDENDNAPQFTNTTFTFQIQENQPVDSFVGKLMATDKDIGRNAELIFSLSPLQTNFAIDPKNGFIRTLHVFDRETLVEIQGNNVITLEATVTDNGSPRLKDKVKVNVYVTDENDHAPKFLRAPYKVQISEGSTVGAQILRLYTQDLDEGLNGDVYYAIVGGNEERRFDIEEATGQIILSKQLDRETTSKYTLTILAHDAAVANQLSNTTTVQIDVSDENDNSPEFTQSESKISISEITAVNTELIRFKAIDSDLGMNSEVVYSITAGNRKDTFHIDQNTGVLYLHKALDYEELSSYQLNITASDNGSPRLSTTILFSIAVEDANDNPPYFPSTAIVRQLKEGIPVHTPIVTVTAYDPDSGINGNVTYSISFQEPDDSHRHFGINSVTGVIHTLLPIDREVYDTFRLTVIATDMAEPASTRLSAEKLVTVIVEDINDNLPIFVSMNAALLPQQKEKFYRQGITVMNVFARDIDSATNGLVTYELVSDPSELFRLDQSTGALKLKKPLSNPEPTYRVSVKATDEAVQSERRSSEAYLTIITESKVPGPTFESARFSGSVFENEPAGTSILTVTGKYHGNDHEIEYYITNVTGDGVQVDRLFDIDTKLGVLSTATELDREAGVDTYEVEVYGIVVGGGGPRTSKTKVEITVLDKNDSPPAFQDAPLHYSVSEDLGPGQPFATIKAEDPDTIGQLEYSILQGGDGKFSLDKKSGVLKLTDSLDRETKDVYKLTIRASDGIQTTDTVVTVEVNDTNDNPPVFLEQAYSFDIPENAIRGSRVGQIKATDADLGVNAQLTYTVISDWANDVFSLNPQTGVFTLTSKLDYEEVQHYILVVQAQDSGIHPLSSTLTVYCNVLDLNDNTPVFDPMSYSNEIFENVTVGTDIVTVSATDLDSGENGKITYTITSGDPNNDFRIFPNGTIISVKPLDRETISLYNLMVTATDQAYSPEKRLSSTVQVTVIIKDVNDMAPEFITPNETTVMENIAKNTMVMAIKALDKDEGRNGYIEYSLSPNPVFSLGSVDGVLRVSGNIDRELRNNYTIMVTAKDRGDPPKSANMTINVKVLDENDNSPVFDPKQYSASIAENASIGAMVLQVSATDVDSGLNGRVRYFISHGDANRDFSIAEDTGVVRVAKNLNYERRSKYVLTVKAEDCAGDISEGVVRSDTAEITILVSDINDNPPTFLDSPYLAYVMENVIPPNGGYVITVKAYDADTPPFNNLVRYFIKEGDTDIFRINASTGDISLLRALDREIQEEYVLSLVAMDTGSPPLTGSGTLRIIVQDINDHSPEFKRQSYYATIKENSPIGSWVLTAMATDKDIGLNAKIRYSLLGDKIDGFKVDQDTGVITTNGILDREDVESYFLTLMAQDCSATEPRATAVNLTVNVLDENDNSPVFTQPKYEVYISDKTKASDFVFGAYATDQDSGLNSRITYVLTGEHSHNFTINESTGVIRAVYDLQRSSTKVFNLEIEAKDGGKPARRTSTELRVHLKPDHLFPRWTPTGYTHFVLPENLKEGKVVAKFTATSPKKGPSGDVNYAIAGGNVGDSLKIDRNSGEIQIAGKGLDYETAKTYEVWIEAQDNDLPPLRSVLRLTINVTDFNDNTPVMKNQLYNATVLEGEMYPLLVTQIAATDRDSGKNGEILYRLQDDFDGTFAIDGPSGEIYTQAKLDRESVASYELTVIAEDQGTPQLSGTSTVLVTVLDKNDNPPRFTRLFSVNVTENAEIGSFVIRVTSSDQDIGENANVTYSFTENPGEKFKIDRVSGNVTVVGHLDREQQDEYLLKVAAFDGAWQSETPLTITIQDQNDNAPEFEQSYYSFNFPELQRDIVFVGQVIAADRDKQGPNSVISYSLQQPSDMFTVDPASGEIFSKRSIRYKYTQMETSPENTYSLTILATDNGKPPMSSECTVTINVVDANNNAPQFEQEEYLSPVPQEALPGQQLLQVMAKDEFDAGVNAEIEYSIVGGNGTGHFGVDRNTGWIALKQKVQGVGSVYTLRLRATDKGIPPQTDETVVTIIVTGENRFSPVFNALSYQVIVPENEPLGSTILIVNATDKDNGPNGMIRYEISSGNEEKDFGIDPITGSVTILQPLDYDTVQAYYLNIIARDLGFKPKQATAVLAIILTDINDNSPVFNQSLYDAFVSENMDPGTFVFQAVATDIDSPKNAIISYSISEGPDKEAFSIDQKTGKITSTVSFDYEEKTTYTLTIVASNPDSNMAGETTLQIHINGVNEYYPKFVQSAFHFDVSESTEIGTKIGTVLATDQDSGEDGKVYYLLVGSSNDRGFSINSESGAISVSRNLDRETQNRIVLTVMAKNAGGIRGNDTDEAQVIVTVQDGNDPPEFLQGMYQADISEAAAVGTKVTTVKAIDKDVRYQNNQFSYSIIAGNVDQAFKVDPQSGDIQSSKELDRETISMYSLTIGAIDTGLPPQTGTTTVQINVLDINDNGPIFDPPQVVGKVLENEPAGTKVMTLSAKDPDLPPNGAPFTYKLVGGKHKDYVRVDKHTGVVVTTRSIDREVTPELQIVIEVEDSGTPKLKSQHPVKIIVLDENDSESTPRSVHVLVYCFNGEFPTGMIANVHPNDPDITGDYKCKILQKSAPTDVLNVPYGCDLHASKATPNQGYSLSISGHDGKHKAVVSSVTVEFIAFDNVTIENSVSLLIKNTSAAGFLANSYAGVQEIIKNSLSRDESLILYSLMENEMGLEVNLAVKSGYVYKSRFYVKDKLQKKREALVSVLQTEDVIIGYSPCGENTCANGGICTESLMVKRTTKITDSQTMIFTSPLVVHEYQCQCMDGFTGPTCDKRQDPCLPNPCQNNGQCRRQGFNYYCVCPHDKDGKNCETERGDVCSENPCQNGGTCKESPDGSSFFCLCRSGYRGNQCEALADSCRPNPCLHGGLCVSLMPGYKCSCTDGRYGRHCEKSTYGFQELSYMMFPSLDATTNDISFVFATTKPDSLLIYNYGLQTLGRSDFVAIELVKGRAVFSFGGARTAITAISAAGKNNDNLADGNWYKITATRNGKVISLNVGSCNENGDVCEDCRPNEGECYTENSGDTGTLNFNNHPVYIGGLNSPDPVLERPGQIHSDDFVGCVHSVSINGRQLNLSHPIQAEGIENKCTRSQSCGKGGVDPCGGAGTCIDRWSHPICSCGNHLLAPNCQNALQPVSLADGAFLEFSITKKHKRMQLLENMYLGTTLWSHQRRTVRSTQLEDLHQVSARSTQSTPDKSISLLFRVHNPNGVLFYATSNKHYTSVELVNGLIVYSSKTSTVVNMTDAHESVTDGAWHNLTLHVRMRSLQVILDGRRIGEELDSAGVHDFLDPYLTYMSLGGVQRGLYYVNNTFPTSFEGCLANFTINREIQPFNGSGTIFSKVISKGKVIQGCNGALGVGQAAIQDPLSIGITLVIVFFVVLLVAILVSFVVFRLRKQYKEKGGGPGGSNGIHSKQNGGPNMGGVGMSVVGDSVLSRGLHGIDNTMSYHTEGDVIRGIGGHSLVGPELVPKKFKERDILQGNDPPRPQRPDIIEREVVTKSPPMREDHHPPLPPSSSHTHDHASNDLNSEMPEHYDLENASSIAPSDIDIVYHYKGFREGGGVRKYKATPPNVAGYHHKHGNAGAQAQHRHSPHHSTGFPPRAPPPVATPTNRPHQSTPLARLSPSSEMSAQQPRILTLHDISGKPLQSALLATTSSSGGVGKDVLHSNSERSLNSPVMSQLSGQSSNRKVAVPPAVTSTSPAMGLTAEEIERLNQRPRNSSLVSTLDAVSSSSEAPRVGGTNHLSNHMRSHSPVPETHHSSSSTDESGNDSFTCSEIEYDNASLPGDDDNNKYKRPGELESRRNDSGSGVKSNIPPPSYDGFDSSYSFVFVIPGAQ
ncbi:cadherin-related tumor suppressor isoform X2 [Anthonomus grandis grandis]|uniref:cadherin-related tumor suppressor isoform X2 n=1 Tax=Anthonomus grandis grandis TaxID=2921223 RepID=UPI002165CEA4|nr:cadherin-related tumor suppressor isoform X2 [Anthonomus grandis grandis]